MYTTVPTQQYSLPTGSVLQHPPPTLQVTCTQQYTLPTGSVLQPPPPTLQVTCVCTPVQFTNEPCTKTTTTYASVYYVICELWQL